MDALNSQTCRISEVRPWMETAASKVTLPVISASAPEATPRLANTPLEGGNELLDRMTSGLIMRQAMDNPVKHDIHDFQAAELELAFKEIG